MKCPKDTWYRARWTQTRSWMRELTGVASVSIDVGSACDPYVRRIQRGFWVKVVEFFDKRKTMVVAEVWTPARKHQRGLALLFFPISPENFVPEPPLQALARVAE